MKTDLFIFGEQKLENRILLKAKFEAYDHGIIEIWKFDSLVVRTDKSGNTGFQIEGGIFWKGLCEPRSWDIQQRNIEPVKRDKSDPTVYFKCSLAFLDIIEMSDGNRFLTLKKTVQSYGRTFGRASKHEVSLLHEEAVILEDSNDLSKFLNTILPLLGVPFGYDVIRIKEDILQKIG